MEQGISNIANADSPYVLIGSDELTWLDVESSYINIHPSGQDSIETGVVALYSGDFSKLFNGNKVKPCWIYYGDYWQMVTSANKLTLTAVDPSDVYPSQYCFANDVDGLWFYDTLLLPSDAEIVPGTRSDIEE